MSALLFSIFWTVGSTVLIVATFDQMADWERALAVLFPAFGLVFVHASWVHWRRRRSLRVEQCDGTAVYVWIELDGRERRATKDPREDWNSDGGDGGGDGGGGD